MQKTKIDFDNNITYGIIILNSFLNYIVDKEILMMPPKCDMKNEKRVRKRDVLALDAGILIVSIACKCFNAPIVIQIIAWGAFVIVLLGFILMFLTYVFDEITRIMIENPVLKRLLNKFIRNSSKKKDNNKKKGK